MQRVERRLSWAQTRRGTTSPSSRQWTASDSNRELPGCRPGALPVGASSPWGALAEGGHPTYHRPGPGAHTSVPGGLRRSWCSAVELSMLRHIHPKVVLRRDGASRTRISPVLETGSLAAGSSLCIRKAARQVSLRAAPGRNWFVPIQKPPASPECPSVARTRVCRHTFRLAGDRLPRVSRVFLPVGVLPVIESTCGQ